MRRVALVLPLSLVALALAGCGSDRQVQPVPGADPERGKRVIEDVGCGACHAIPGIRMADGRVGPPLDDFGGRRTVAGKLPNTPQALAHWLRFPQAVVPGNDMPNLRLSRREARDIAAYLLQRT